MDVAWCFVVAYLGSNLVTALASLNVHDFPHFVFVISRSTVFNKYMEICFRNQQVSARLESHTVNASNGVRYTFSNSITTGEGRMGVDSARTSDWSALPPPYPLNAHAQSIVIKNISPENSKRAPNSNLVFSCPVFCCCFFLFFVKLN